MADLATLKARVQTIVIDLPAETDAEFEDLIKDAQRELEDERCFLATEELHSATTVADTRLLDTKPADWNGRRSKPYYIDGTGATVHFDWLPSVSDRVKLYSEDPTDRGAPKHLEETATGFNVYPLPDGLCPSGSLYSDGEYRIRIPYWKHLDELTGSEENWFSQTRRGNFLVYKAAEMGLLLNRDPERLSYLQLATVEKKKLKRKDALDRLGDGLVITPRADVNAASTQGRL